MRVRFLEEPMPEETMAARATLLTSPVLLIDRLRLRIAAEALAPVGAVMVLAITLAPADAPCNRSEIKTSDRLSSR